MRGAAVVLAAWVSVVVAAPALAQQALETEEPAPLARGYRTRALAAAWGHSWLHGWPGYGKAITDIAFVGFYPQMGWLVTDSLELFGEGTAHVYYRPHTAILGGVVGIAGRHYFLTDRRWTPYYLLGGGMIWTSLRVPELDRIWNFQVVWGAGVKRLTRRGPGLMVEFRNHHISNAGTRGENLGVNAATVIVGAHWVLRPRPGVRRHPRRLVSHLALSRSRRRRQRSGARAAAEMLRHRIDQQPFAFAEGVRGVDGEHADQPAIVTH